MTQREQQQQVFPALLAKKSCRKEASLRIQILFHSACGENVGRAVLRIHDLRSGVTERTRATLVSLMVAPRVRVITVGKGDRAIIIGRPMLIIIIC